MTYQFFRYPDLKADIGLLADGDRLGIHFASQGGTQAGESRNADRRTAYDRLLKQLAELRPSAKLLGYRAGKGNRPGTEITGGLASCQAELQRAHRDGGGFRFDLGLLLDPPMTVETLATSLGLEGIEHAPVAVVWPDEDAPEMSEDEREAFVSALDHEIRAVTDPSATGPGKWRQLETLIAQRVGLPVHEVVVAYVSDQRHLHNRRKQRWGEPSLRLLLTPSAEPKSATLKAMEDAVNGKIDQDSAAVAVAAPTPEGWRILNIFALRQPSSEAALKLAALAGVPLPTGADDDESLARSLYVPVKWIRDVLWLISDKKGVIFYGPPGTGKTYLAQKLAERIQRDKARRTLVQLHPSYGYEDFFEGYRPVEPEITEGHTAPPSGGLQLRKLPGPLRLLTSKLAGTDDIGVLILDEMNRGNLPRVFGELYFLLEYRNEAVSLMYSPKEEFKLPEGLRVIGTMNTADRSVALLDQALRRRFHFVDLFPSEEPVKGMLRAYLKEHYGERMNWVADVLEKANTKLEQHAAVGPSHFMRDDLDEETVERIWTHSVLPTIAEHYFGQTDRIADFALKSLRGDQEPGAAATHSA